MRTIHLADIHQDGGSETLQARALETAYNKITIAKPDIVFLNGDIFDDAATPESRMIIRDFVYKLADDNTHVIITRGNHDKPLELESQFGKLQSRGIWVSERPQRIIIDDFSADNLLILTIPHFAGAAIASDMDNVSDFHHSVTEKIASVLDDYFQKVRSHNGPSICVFHGVVEGARLDNGQIPRKNGIYLPLSKLEALGCPVIGGHYHACQQVGNHTWYSGSITRNNFGEEGDKGLLIVDYEDGWKKPKFVSLNPPRMFRINARFEDEKFIHDPIPEDLSANDIIRIRYEVKDTDQEHPVLQAELERVSKLCGSAMESKIERRIHVSEAARVEAINDADTVEDGIQVYLESLNVEGTPVYSPEEIASMMNLYKSIMEVAQEVAA